MEHEKLNYECAIKIQEDIQLHAGALEVIISLLRSSNESYHLDNFDFKLGVLIESWLDELTNILDRAVNEIRDEPQYTLWDANRLLKLFNEKIPVSQDSVDEAINRLGSVVDNYGAKAFPEAVTLLSSIYELREKTARKTKKTPD